MTIDQEEALEYMQTLAIQHGMNVDNANKVVEFVRNQHKEIKDLNSQLEDYKTEIEDLKIQLEEKKQQNKYLLTELKMLNNVIVDYQLQNAELKAKIKRLESLEYQSV